VLILRPVAEGDLDALVGLAAQLDSVNLPSDREFLAERIEASLSSFAAAQGGAAAALRASEAAGERSRGDWRDGVYVFVLEDAERGACVGTSTLVAKHGRPGRPYFWLAVTREERRSAELGRRFVHTKLQLHSSENGPTEVGGLVLDPSYRNDPERCGKALSIVRFAFISMHPQLFEREVIAEMLPPLQESGVKTLWDAFGARFTGLSYREADQLSARSKQFIADLFPRDPVYTTLFPEDVQAMIGRTQADAAARILEKLGFRYLNQVDPFDGGPYYGAGRDAIASVRERRQLVLQGVAPEPVEPGWGPLALLSAEGRQGFRSTVVPLDDEDAPIVSKECREALGVSGGDRVNVTPLS
jgi:arginine N-succinyltransferase